MSPERVGKNQWGFHVWDWCQQPLFFFTVQELCSEHVTLFMFVSVLCSILTYKLLLCFFFSVLLAKIFYLTLCQRNLYFLCLFFVLCVSAIFLHAPLTNIWKVLNSVSRSWVFQLAKLWNSKQWKCWFVWKRLKKFLLSWSHICCTLCWATYFFFSFL